MDPIRIFIGYDDVETVAFWVAAHSITRRATVPVAIIPLNKKNIARDYWRPRGEYDSTDFSNSRWLVPHLSRFEGWSVFVDCDVLFLDDIANLWDQRDDRYSVMVRKHNHVPRETTKFLDQPQSKYERKNWSSLVLFNNYKCRPLTRHIVNTMTPGLWFHRFEWLADDEIGELSGNWNFLAGVQDKPSDAPNMVHYTLGGAWHGYNDTDYADVWWAEYDAMLQGDNPIDYREQR